MRLREIQKITEERRLGKVLAADYPYKYVRIYRACPAACEDFHDMDYVTLNKRWAEGHAEHMEATEEEPFHVISKMVPAAHVYDAYNPGEYFYHPSK